MSTISVILNGETKSLPTTCNVQEAISHWALKATQFAIAVNESFIPRGQYEQTQLNEGDQIELLVPMQGG